MINFLHPKLLPSVYCSDIADDGYKVENLISSNPIDQSMGFMAYPVLKPPIDVIFTLSCDIELRSIIMFTKLGSLKSTAFEVFIKSKAGEYILIGSCYNLIEDEVTWTSSSTNHPSETIDENRKFLKFFRTLGHRRTIRTVKICIKSTARCAPVVKRIEILGIPSRQIPVPEQNDIWRKWNNRSNQMLCIQYNQDQKTVKAAAAAKTTVNSQKDDDFVPEEYLDTITYEIMSLPMILPSGKILDKSTLDKHNRMEECWGRSPTDPFTGVAFNEFRKPILNAALKTQIDRFLLENSDRIETKTVARTVGPACNKRTLDIINGSLSGYFKRQRTSTNKCPETITRLQSQPSVAKCNEFQINEPETRDEVKEQKKTSIDEAVEMALKNITRFSKQTNAERTNKDFSIQTCFNNCIPIDNILYQIKSCNHFVCRTCLLNTKNEFEHCGICGLTFTKIDIIRFFKKDII